MSLSLYRSLALGTGALLLVGLATAANAQTTILSNLTQTVSGSQAAGVGASQYQAFKTDNHTYKVKDVTVRVNAARTTDKFTVALFGYSPTNATTLIGTVGTVTGLSTVFSNVTLTAGSTILLAPSTSYWLGILNPLTNAANINWSTTASSATTGVGTYQNNPTRARSFNSGATLNATTNVGVAAQMFSIRGTVVAAAGPEPASLGMLLLGVPALGLIRRRRK